MSKLVENIKKKIQGDDENALAIKIEKVAISAFKSEIAVLEGEVLELEDKVETCKESLEEALVNSGKKITDKGLYIRHIIECKNEIIKAEEDLKSHLETIAFLSKIFQENM